MNPSTPLASSRFATFFLHLALAPLQNMDSRFIYCNTYLAGEKYVMPEGYDGPNDVGDAAPMLAGYSGSTIRWAATLSA